MLAAILRALMTLDASRVTSRLSRAVVDYAIAGTCFLIGLVFLVAAGFVFAVERYGAIQACLGFGAGFIVLALLALALHKIRSRLAARRFAREAKATQLKTLAGATAIALLPALMKGRGGLVGGMLPVLAMAAYAIYNENAPRRDDDRRDADD